MVDLEARVLQALLQLVSREYAHERKHPEPAANGPDEPEPLHIVAETDGIADEYAARTQHGVDPVDDVLPVVDQVQETQREHRVDRFLCCVDVLDGACLEGHVLHAGRGGLVLRDRDHLVR